MTTSMADVSPRRAASIAGLAYLALFVLALFANFVVREGLIESGDAAATAANIADSEGLFRAGIVAFLVVFVLDVVIAWALYIFFKAVSVDVSLLSAWFRLVYTVFLGVALIFSFLVLDLVSGADSLGAFERGQLDAQTVLFLDAFDYAWLIGLACFGVHLVLMGLLMIRSGSMPKLIAYLLIAAGVAYVADTLANALLANYDDVEDVFLAIVAVPSVIGELSLTIWLLARAGRTTA